MGKALSKVFNPEVGDNIRIFHEYEDSESSGNLIADGTIKAIDDDPGIPFYKVRYTQGRGKNKETLEEWFPKESIQPAEH